MDSCTDRRPPHKRTQLRDVNVHLTCALCAGYYIDATTIVECLHSFCRSCIVKHLKLKSYCPVCEVLINTAKPNIKPDKTLQDIVYKLVPGLHRNEMRRRRRFYASMSGPDSRPICPSIDSEQRGVDNERIVYDSNDKMSLSLEYFDGIEPHLQNNVPLRRHEHVYADPTNGTGTRIEARIGTDPSKPPIRYLECVAGMAIRLLKKFVVAKFDIDTSDFNVDILYKGIPLADHYTIMDIAYIYSWKRNEPMRFFFQVTDQKTHDEKLYFESQTNYLIHRTFNSTKIHRTRPKRLTCDRSIEQKIEPETKRVPGIKTEIDPVHVERIPVKADPVPSEEPKVIPVDDVEPEKICTKIVEDTSEVKREVVEETVTKVEETSKVEDERDSNTEQPQNELENESKPEKRPEDDVEKIETSVEVVKDLQKDLEVEKKDPEPEQRDPEPETSVVIDLEPENKDPVPEKSDPDEQSKSSVADTKPDRSDDEKSMFLIGFELTSTKSVCSKKPVTSPKSQPAPPTLKLILERIPTTSGISKEKNVSSRPIKRKLGRPPGRPPGKKLRVGDVESNKLPCPVTKMVRNVTAQSDHVSKLVSKRKPDDPDLGSNSTPKKQTGKKNGMKVPSQQNDPQTKALKSLFDSCNLNIPSSLSITLTDPEKDDDIPTSQNPVQIKRQSSSPNMYIEIIKIPEKQDSQVAKIVPGRSILKKMPKETSHVPAKTSDGFVVPFATPRLVQQTHQPVLQRPGTPQIVPNACNGMPGPGKVPNLIKPNVKVAIPNSNFIVTTTGIQSLGHKTSQSKQVEATSNGHTKQPFATSKPSGSKLAESGFQKMFEETIKKKEEARSKLIWSSGKLRKSLAKEQECEKSSVLDLSSPSTKSDENSSQQTLDHQKRPFQSTPRPVEPAESKPSKGSKLRSALQNVDTGKSNSGGSTRSVLKNGKSQHQSDLISSSEPSTKLNVDTNEQKDSTPAQLSPDTIQQQFNLTNLAQLNASVEHILMLRQHMEFQNRLSTHSPWMLNANSFVHFENYVKNMQQRIAQHAKK